MRAPNKAESSHPHFLLVTALALCVVIVVLIFKQCYDFRIQAAEKIRSDAVLEGHDSEAIRTTVTTSSVFFFAAFYFRKKNKKPRDRLPMIDQFVASCSCSRIIMLPTRL
jgi:hypothetical protein